MLTKHATTQTRRLPRAVAALTVISSLRPVCCHQLKTTGSEFVYWRSASQTVDDLLPDQLKPRIHKHNATIGYWSSPELPPPARTAADENQPADAPVWLCGCVLANMSFSPDGLTFSFFFLNSILKQNVLMKIRRFWLRNSGRMWEEEHADVWLMPLLWSLSGLSFGRELRELFLKPAFMAWKSKIPTLGRVSVSLFFGPLCVVELQKDEKRRCLGPPVCAGRFH